MGVAQVAGCTIKLEEACPAALQGSTNFSILCVLGRFRGWGDLLNKKQKADWGNHCKRKGKERTLTKVLWEERAWSD